MADEQNRITGMTAAKKWSQGEVARTRQGLRGRLAAPQGSDTLAQRVGPHFVAPSVTRAIHDSKANYLSSYSRNQDSYGEG